MSTPHIRPARWLLPLLALATLLAPGASGAVAHAQSNDCQLDNLRGSQGCTLRPMRQAQIGRAHV